MTHRPYHPGPDDARGGQQADPPASKGDPDAMGPDAPGTGAKTVGGVVTASGAGQGDQPAGGTSGVELEKQAHPGEGVVSGGGVAAAMEDAGIQPPRSDDANSPDDAKSRDDA